MSSSDFTFVPRKLSKHSGKSPQNRAAASTNLDSNPSNLTRQDGRSAGQWEDAVERRAGPSKARKENKFLSDNDYANLLTLALSDYALWSNRELLELMETNEEGFISLRRLSATSPVLSGLSPMPSESTLIRCIKDSKIFERRMVVTGQTLNGGGFEIRRSDWQTAKERLRRYTSFQWDMRTIYIENLPPNARTVPSVFRFLLGLYEDQQKSDEAHSLVQSISFPRHRDDDPDGPHPSRSRGFAFVVLLRATDADYLLQRWPWKTERGSEPVGDAMLHAESDARGCGFRCMSKRTWGKLKTEYLERQQKLFEETISGNTFNSKSVGRSWDAKDDVQDELLPPCEENTNKSAFTTQAPYLQPQESSSTYPKDCLIFVRNVHPETNKTTLKNLFSKPLSGQSGAIDYVDYNKGLDSCYLRLLSSDHARILVQHFITHKVLQINGLDNLGSASPPGASDPIEAELVQGKKEEVYWEKVPEKVRRQALEKAATQIIADPEVVIAHTNDSTTGGRKAKRKKTT